MCQFCVCYSNIYNLYMYKHKTVRNRLIGYLVFISVNWNLETTDRLTSYSVKVHSTSRQLVILYDGHLLGLTHTHTHTHIVGRPATTLKLSQRTRVSLGLKCSKFCPLFPPALPTEKISPLCLFYIFSYHYLIAILICMLLLWINVSGT